jgi:diguanylate cyclase (GGDEF)-like protein
MQTDLLKLLCKKSALSYVVFNDSFIVSSSNDKSLTIGSDIRDSLWELIGLEESIIELIQNNENIKLPMILREGIYYDLEIEVFHNDTQINSFIAIIQKRSQHTQEYADVLKQINKKTLIYDLSQEKKEQNDYKQINKHLITLHVNLDGIVTMVNDAALNFFNLERKKLIDLHFSELFKPQKSQINSLVKIFLAKNSANEDIFFHADIIPITDKKGNIKENIIIAQDITHLKKIKKELEYAQQHDALTGLPNRHYFLNNTDKRAKEENCFYLCFIDINDFHMINEEYGAHAADMLLKHLTTLLLDFLEADDIPMRLHADNFVISFAQAKTQEYIQALIQKLEILVNENPLYYNSEDKIIFSFTTLLINYPNDAKTTKDLLQKVEKMMKRKKIELKS